MKWNLRAVAVVALWLAGCRSGTLPSPDVQQSEAVGARSECAIASRDLGQFLAGGARIVPVREGTRLLGLRLYEVNGAPARSGFRNADLLEHINGEPVSMDLPRALTGSEVRFKILRDGKPTTLRCSLGG
jgi:hypothetical protein